MASGRVRVDGGSLYYEDTGKGLPVVMIHAGYLDSRMWDNQMEAFSKQYRVIRYDVRGYGKSSRSLKEYSDASDLKALLDYLNVNKVVLMGVSNGGRISFDFAVEYPERVKAMIAVDFGIRGYKGSGPDEDKLWESFQYDEEKYLRLRDEGKYREAAAIDVDTWTHTLSPEEREHILDIAAENVIPKENDPDILQVSPVPPAFERLDTLVFPILVIVGSLDVPGIVTLDTRTQALLRNSDMVVIEGADHIPSLSKPKEFRDSVLAFLKTVR